MAIGNRIYELRKSEKLTQEKLAEKIGVTRQTISNWELNESSPDLKQAKELSNVFNISLDELVENNIRDILLDKTNKSNINMNKLNKIMLSMLISIIVLITILLLILISLNTISNGKKKSDDYTNYRGVMAVCEVNDEAVFISTPAADFEKIKQVYESQGGKCYDREVVKPKNED